MQQSAARAESLRFDFDLLAKESKPMPQEGLKTFVYN